MQKLNHSQMKELLISVHESNRITRKNHHRAISVYIAGKPGIGKNDVIRNAARVIVPERQGDLPVKKEMDYMEINLSRKAPVDVNGWPHLSSDALGRPRMDYAIPVEYPMTPGAVIHLEEINIARVETMKAAYSLLLEYRVGAYEVPQDTLIVASGNAAGDSSVVNDMPAPLVNRVLVAELVLDTDEWLSWAYNAGVHPLIVSTLSFQTNLIHDLPAEGDWESGTQFATPRSWEALSCFLSANPETKGPVREAAVCGLVGAAAGKQFLNILELEDTLPQFKDVLDNPADAPLPTDESAKICSLWILSTALGMPEQGRNWEQNFKKTYAYVTRFQHGEMTRLYLSLVSRATKGEANTIPAFMALFQRHQGFFRRA